MWKLRDNHESIGNLFKTVGKMPRIAEEHDGINSIIAAVEAGRGFALVSSSLACMVGQRLKLIPIESGVPPIIVGAAWRLKDESDLVQKFIAGAQGK